MTRDEASRIVLERACRVLCYEATVNGGGGGCGCPSARVCYSWDEYREPMRAALEVVSNMMKGQLGQVLAGSIERVEPTTVSRKRVLDL